MYNEQESLFSSSYAFGGTTPVEIFRYICQVLDDTDNISLNVGKQTTSISFYGKVVFRIRINSKTQCLDTEEELALGFTDKIKGAWQTKNSAHFPLVTDAQYLPVVVDLLKQLLDYCWKLSRVEPFGCCNDHVRCSDAGRCLHPTETFYLGCMYRKNLEEGRIFYGDNRNID